MKKTKFTIVISLLILIFIFIVIGCESENEILPDYILDWVFEGGSNNILLKLDNEHWNNNNYFNDDSFGLISDKDSLLSTFNEQRVLLFSLDSAFLQ